MLFFWYSKSSSLLFFRTKRCFVRQIIVWLFCVCWCYVLEWIWCFWCYSECAPTPGKLKSLPDHVFRQTFQLARCGCTLRVTWETSLFVETVIKMQCTIKQCLDDGFVISRIIKVSLSVSYLDLYNSGYHKNLIQLLIYYVTHSIHSSLRAHRYWSSTLSEKCLFSKASSIFLRIWGPGKKRIIRATTN